MRKNPAPEVSTGNPGASAGVGTTAVCSGKSACARGAIEARRTSDAARLRRARAARESRRNMRLPDPGPWAVDNGRMGRAGRWGSNSDGHKDTMGCASKIADAKSAPHYALAARPPHPVRKMAARRDAVGSAVWVARANPLRRPLLPKSLIHNALKESPGERTPAAPPIRNIRGTTLGNQFLDGAYELGGVEWLREHPPLATRAH